MVQLPIKKHIFGECKRPTDSYLFFSSYRKVTLQRHKLLHLSSYTENLFNHFTLCFMSGKPPEHTYDNGTLQSDASLVTCITCTDEVLSARWQKWRPYVPHWFLLESSPFFPSLKTSQSIRILHRLNPMSPVKGMQHEMAQSEAQRQILNIDF